MRLRTSAGTALSVCALAAFGLAACGGDDDNSGASTAPASTAASTTGGASTGTSTSTTAGAIDPNKPETLINVHALKIPAVDLLTPYLAGANAAADVINAQGGFGGSKLVIDGCNTQYSPPTATTCARKSVPKKPVASVGCDPIWPVSGLTVLAKAEILSINCPNVDADYNNPWNLAITGGQTGDQGVTAKWLCTKPEVKKIVYFTQDIPFQHTDSPKLLTPIIKGCGKSISYVFYPITGADITPQIQQAASKKPDFVMTLGGGALAVNIYKLFAQAGIPADKIIGSANQMAYQSVLKPAGSVMDGAYATSEVQSWGDTSNADVAAYLKAMQGAGYDAQDPNPETAYMYVMAIYTAAQKIGFDKFNSTTLRDWFDTANGVPLPVSRSVANPSPPGYPRVKQPYVQIVQWKGGKLNVVTEGTDQGWLNGFTK